MKEYDILIVGGGILGIAHAYHCLKAGLKVALLEKNAEPQGATVRNFGQVVPSGFGSKWQQYGRKSLYIYRQLQEQVDLTVQQEGSMYLASDAEEMTLLEELATINRRNGYTSELWMAAACIKRYPGLKKDYVRGGLYFPGEIKIDPRQMASRLLRYLCQTYGLDYYPHHLATEAWQASGRVNLCTATQEHFTGQKLFICNGSDFQTLFPEVFAKSELELVKLQMLETVPQKEQYLPGSILTGWTIRRYEAFSECPSYAAIKAKEDQDSFHQQKGIHLLLKQSPNGSLILGDSHKYQMGASRQDPDFTTDHKVNRFIIEETQKIFDLENWQISQTWLGYYCQCKERDIFKHTIDQHIHIVTGIGGKGMTAALGFAEQNVYQSLSLNFFNS